jgi:NADH-quinone oxidoreductase subunit M
MFLAFAIKIPLFPFHGWLPSFHEQAPTIGSVEMAAIMMKLGTIWFPPLCIANVSRSGGFIE